VTTDNSVFTNPIVVMDVGARNGMQSFWSSSPYPVKLIGFEPDQEECRTLNNRLLSSDHSKNGHTITYYPVALGRERGKRKLYLYKDRRLSSFFLPNVRLLSHFPLDMLLMPEAFSIDEEIIIDCVSLDEFCRSQRINDVDFIKVDTQGSEMEILQGGSDVLARTFAIAIEVEFVPIYENQPLFADVDLFLRKQGFSLFDLNRHWWKRAVPKGVVSRGQMIFADTIYLRDLWNPESSSSFWKSLLQEPERIAKAVVIASLLGFSDYALDLLNYHLNLHCINKTQYDAWKKQYIHLQKQQENISTSILYRLLRKYFPSHVFWKDFTKLIEQQHTQLLNTRFYDNDESKNYR
jgi:FkbM family methyltransferase